MFVPHTENEEWAGFVFIEEYKGVLLGSVLSWRVLVVIEMEMSERLLVGNVNWKVPSLPGLGKIAWGWLSRVDERQRARGSARRSGRCGQAASEVGEPLRPGEALELPLELRKVGVGAENVASGCSCCP